MTNQQDDSNYSIIDQFVLYIKDGNEGKYKDIAKKSEENCVGNVKNPKGFIEYLKNKKDVCKNTEEFVIWLVIKNLMK